MGTLTEIPRNAAINALVDLVDAGAAAGKLEIYTAADVLLVSITLADPAFGAASGGSAAISGAPSGTIANTGTAAKFSLKDSDGTTIVSGTVGTSGADLNFDSVAFEAAGTATITAFTFTMNA